MELTEFPQGYFRSIGYDEIEKQLHVRLQDERYLIFYEVDQIDYVGLMSSNNMKDFFHGRIEDRYPARTITE
ncbi:KTSC domain-containing protein [Salipaludibacillus sp. LMS25]|jgi:hypothetical protein|uniref:KTSC domain-containing protein n=1 Tax=Salipaludibacillus sp. LMS25 TaxID=2924031 RepID=UPI0020D0EA16|nr:KTSC domain-containing protein [Salipaludibacillus sp. LMS25]UTR15438.1 KTSC domain-containing protein [Salipaludibacillus sp. LMS25]